MPILRYHNFTSTLQFLYCTLLPLDCLADPVRSYTVLSRYLILLSDFRAGVPSYDLLILLVMSADIGIGVLIGAGVLLTIVATTYVMAYFVDTLCSSPDVERISSPVSNQAGLWGMTLDERTKILEKAFQIKKTILRYQKSHAPMKKDVAIGEEAGAGASKEIEMTEIKPASTATEHSSTASNTTETEGNTDDVSSDNSPSHQEQPTEDNNTDETDRDLETGDGNSSSGNDDSAADIAAGSSREEQISMGMLPTHELSPENLETMCAICLVEYGRFKIYIFSSFFFVFVVVTIFLSWSRTLLLTFLSSNQKITETRSFMALVVPITFISAASWNGWKKATITVPFVENLCCRHKI